MSISDRRMSLSGRIVRSFELEFRVGSPNLLFDFRLSACTYTSQTFEVDRKVVLTRMEF